MICTTCNQNPGGHKNRNICNICSDKYAKIYYKHKVSGIAWPESMDIIENIRQADATLEGITPAPTNPAEAQAVGSTVWLHWDACKPAGHVGLKTMDGDCWFCANGIDREPLERSPRQQAIIDGSKWYPPIKPCPRCGSRALRRVADGACQDCHDGYRQRVVEPRSPRQKAIATGEKWYVPTKPCSKCGSHAIRRVTDGACHGCHTPRAVKLRSPRQQAIIDGRKWYTPATPCTICGTTALRHVDTSRCRGCAPEADRTQSPRQQAIATGAKWYNPTTPCPKCDSLALRRVTDGACQGCTPTRDIPANTLPADTVLSRADARLLGLAHYRTGLYCPHGHNGFRLVTTGACVECKQRP